MFIFNRTTTLNRNRLMEATMASVEVAGLVTRITGVGVNVFATLFGDTGNTLSWSCRADTQAALGEMTAKLNGNEEYLAWALANSEMYESAVTDQLSAVISSTMTAEPKRYYTVLTAQAAAGKWADAVAFGVKAQQLVADKTGLATGFMTGVYGPYGTVGWLTGADTMADLDTLWSMQMGDADYHALVADAGPLFIETSGNTRLIEKLN